MGFCSDQTLFYLSTRIIIWALSINQRGYQNILSFVSRAESEAPETDRVRAKCMYMLNTIIDERSQCNVMCAIDTDVIGMCLLWKCLCTKKIFISKIWQYHFILRRIWKWASENFRTNFKSTGRQWFVRCCSFFWYLRQTVFTPFRNSQRTEIFCSAFFRTNGHVVTRGCLSPDISESWDRGPWNGGHRFFSNVHFTA